ncbi:hypothetical protein [Oribacterium sp. HCP3S3_B9]|uniref:hypothetical protein n=1 Tax=Oribacterium sp. HCP3S3_B9 TaxID=3438946 RepID=UPI003F88B579
MSIYEFTKGKKVDVDYETGYHFVITYLSENKLHWDALSKTAEGAPAHEDEPYTSYAAMENTWSTGLRRPVL